MQTETFTEKDWPDQPIQGQKQDKQEQKNVAENEPRKLKGVYRDEGELYRAAIRPLSGSKWYTLGYFVCPDVAAYVFNMYALTMGLPHLVNQDINPNKDELQKWRERRPENAQREQSAMVEFHKVWGNKQ